MKTTLLAACALFVGGTAFAADPYTAKDDTWITINGTVSAVKPDAFTLDYGKKKVTVEMDDWSPDADGFKLRKGDKVTVSGIVDDDFLETATVEAASVYVKGLNTYFFANAGDEEDFVPTNTVATLVTVVKPMTVVQGKITGVSGREFTVDTGPRKITVDTAALAENPLDNRGFQKLEKGDRVSVLGQVDDDLFEKRELMAKSIVTLEDSPPKSGVGGSGKQSKSQSE